MAFLPQKLLWHQTSFSSHFILACSNATELGVQNVSKEFLEKCHILNIILVFDSLSFIIIVITAAATA